MLDLCGLIVALVIDLFRPRAAVEAEILVLRQQIIVLRRGRPGWPVAQSTHYTSSMSRLSTT
jgi:hypothetical protein